VTSSPRPGGQIYRNITEVPLMIAAMLGTDYRHGNSLATRLMHASVKLRFGTLVWDVAGDLTVAAQHNGRSFQVQSPQLIAATGAIERVSPLPGWTLPGVLNAGAAPVALKSAASMPAGRVVLAGGGPLLLLVACRLFVRWHEPGRHRRNFPSGHLLASVATRCPGLPGQGIANDVASAPCSYPHVCGGHRFAHRRQRPGSSAHVHSSKLDLGAAQESERSSVIECNHKGSSGMVVHQNHWTAKKRQPRLRTLLWADNTSQKANFEGNGPGNECWRAILSDCLEQQFEMVAGPATSQQTSRKHFVFEDILLSEFLLEVSFVEAAGRKPQREIDGAKDSHRPSSRLTFRGARADANQGRKYSRKVALMGKPGRYCDLGK
jgi:hypothetical protein